MINPSYSTYVTSAEEKCMLCTSVRYYNLYYRSIKTDMTCNTEEYLKIAEQASDWYEFYRFYIMTADKYCTTQDNNTLFGNHVWKDFYDFSNTYCSTVQQPNQCIHC